MKTTQQKILGFIQTHLNQHQIPPTLRDIQDHFGFSAIGTVQYHLKNLSDAGFLDIRPRLSRGITLTAKAMGIPIVGKVAAGPGQLAFEELEGYLPAALLTPPAPYTASGHHTTAFPTIRPADTRGLFALRIKGDSMVEAGILEGDIVVVRPQASA